MAKKPLVTDRERNAIAIAFNSNPKAKAEAIRQIASARCGRELGLSTVQRELAKLRKRHPKGSTNPLDDQWSLASLTEYPVDPAAIPFLLYIQYTFDANIPEEVKQFARRERLSQPFMTNRMAIWLSRLLRLPQPEPPSSTKKKIWTPPVLGGKNPASTSKNPAQWDEYLDDLVNVAMWYSNYEIGCELADVKPINTIYFDAPTLEQIKLNILMYNKPILQSKGIVTGNEPNKLEILESMDVEDIVPKGGKHNARSHSKEK
jgi:hypothetical protein